MRLSEVTRSYGKIKHSPREPRWRGERWLINDQKQTHVVTD